MKIFKRLFCKHDMKLIYSGVICKIETSGYLGFRFSYTCNKCGKSKDECIYINEKLYKKIMLCNGIYIIEIKNKLIRRLNNLDRYTNPKYVDTEFYVVDEVYDLIDDVFDGIPEDTGSID